jgi:hypothetical protein
MSDIAEEYCTECGLETEEFVEGYCRECHEYRQGQLDLHNARYERWRKLTPKQQWEEIRRAGRLAL